MTGMEKGLGRMAAMETKSERQVMAGHGSSLNKRR